MGKFSGRTPSKHTNHAGQDIRTFLENQQKPPYMKMLEEQRNPKYMEMLEKQEKPKYMKALSTQTKPGYMKMLEDIERSSKANTKKS